MTDMKRRTFLARSMAAGAAGVLLGTGMLKPSSVLAAWPKEAFQTKDFNTSLSAMFGSDAVEESDKVKFIKLPEIAENGAVVPVIVEADLPDVEEIAIYAMGNNTPLTVVFKLTPEMLPFVSTRIKVAKTSELVAVAKSGGKLYSAKKLIKVTIGGCGG